MAIFFSIHLSRRTTPLTKSERLTREQTYQVFLKTEEAIALQIGSAPPQIYKRLYNLATFCGAISSAVSNKSR